MPKYGVTNIPHAKLRGHKNIARGSQKRPVILTCTEYFVGWTAAMKIKSPCAEWAITSLVRWAVSLLTRRQLMTFSRTHTLDDRVDLLNPHHSSCKKYSTFFSQKFLNENSSLPVWAARPKYFSKLFHWPFLVYLISPYIRESLSLSLYRSLSLSLSLFLSL